MEWGDKQKNQTYIISVKTRWGMKEIFKAKVWWNAGSGNQGRTIEAYFEWYYELWMEVLFMHIIHYEELPKRHEYDICNTGMVVGNTDTVGWSI